MQALTFNFLCVKISKNYKGKKVQKPEIPTLDDVARDAKVSTATVSRCLNFPDRVSAKTRDKVMKVVKDLGYTPNFGAQALAAKRTNTFGAIVPTMNNAIFAAGLQAFQEELGEKGATLLLASSSYNGEIEEEQIRSLVSRGADGLLLIGIRRDEKIYRFLEDRQIPFVIAWSYQEHKTRSCVGFENFEASYALTKKAIALSHKKFATISAHIKENDRAESRVKGIQKALQDEGVNPRDLMAIECDYSIQNGAESFEEIMKSDHRPSIVMCGNDVLAVGAIKQAHRMGLKIPHDVSITGFDDIELAQVIEPELTTVHVPHKTMGKLAAQMLLKKTQDQTHHENIKLETRIVEGKSLGKPKSLNHGS